MKKNVTATADVEIEYETTMPGIKELEFDVDLSREDLNDVVGKLKDKINEIVRIIRK